MFSTSTRQKMLFKSNIYILKKQTWLCSFYWKKQNFEGFFMNGGGGWVPPEGGECASALRGINTPWRWNCWGVGEKKCKHGRLTSVCLYHKGGRRRTALRRGIPRLGCGSLSRRANIDVTSAQATYASGFALRSTTTTTTDERHRENAMPISSAT